MNSDFTFWGHNCFLIETDREALLLDPWLNDTGAFFGSWHQWPPNGHLREAVKKRCAEKKLSIFLSHEHQNHFDKSTLAALSDHPDCTVPAYKDKYLLEALGWMNLRTVELAEGKQAGGDIQFRISRQPPPDSRTDAGRLSSTLRCTAMSGTRSTTTFRPGALPTCCGAG